MTLTDTLLKYVIDSETPVTSTMAATALNIDADEAAQGLSGMNKRSKPLIARQPVSPERKTSKNMRFEYMSLAMAKELGVEVVPKQKVTMPDAPGQIDLPPLTVELPIIDIPPEPVGAIERMARLMGRRIARIMMEALQSEIEEQLEAMGNDLIEKWAEESLKPVIRRTHTQPLRPNKPKVLIAGLLPAQAGMIVDEFSEVFDLRFYMTDENLKKLAKMLPGVDHFVTFTSKIEHQTEKTAQSMGIPIIRCSGGMTMLRQKLEELYINEKA
jgi:hypothetical protein